MSTKEDRLPIIESCLDGLRRGEAEPLFIGDIEWLVAEAGRLRAEVEQVELINFRRVEENTRLGAVNRELRVENERLKSGQHTINIAGTSSESAGTVTVPCGYAAEVERLTGLLPTEGYIAS